MVLEVIAVVINLRWAHPVRTSIVVLMSLILVSVCVGAVYQWAAVHRDMNLNHPPGQLVDVGGYRMHLYCIGQGSPTVVLEAGLGDTWLTWYKVQPMIARVTRACSYDRSGMGWSDPSPYPRTSKVFAEELHRLLHYARIPRPFVLVGHSLGGMTVRMYTSLYRDDVSAVVLLDSAYPDQDERLPVEVEQSNARFLRDQTFKEDTMFFGLPRLMGWCGDGSPEVRSALRAVDCRVGPWKEHLAEYNSRRDSSDQVRSAGTFGNIPLVVLSADPDKFYVGPGLSPNVSKRMNEAWDAMQADLVNLSINGHRIIAKGSGHMIQWERPELVAEVVRKLIVSRGTN